MKKPSFPKVFATTTLASAFSIAVMLPVPASAQTANSTIAVSAVVLSFCTVVATPLVFGNYSRAVIDAASSLAVVCTNGTPYNIGLGTGNGTDATVAARQMTGTVAGSLLAYSLYQDALRANLWGSTIGTDTLASTGTGLLQTLPVYGRIPAGQSPAPGAYLDTVTVLLTW